MKMITPVNGHILIEPLVIDGFIASAKDAYQEIGVVVALDSSLVTTHLRDDSIGAVSGGYAKLPTLNVGDKVYFDAWLAKKYPKEGTTNEYYWLVKWENVTAVEYAE